MKRNKHLISSKKAVKFYTKHAEWCTYLNVEEMYNEVYSNLVASRLAVKHDDTVRQNAAGDVNPENESLGCCEDIQVMWEDATGFGTSFSNSYQAYY